MFVAGDSVRKVHLTRQPTIGEQLHRAIDGRVTDTRILLADNSIDVLDAAVPFVLDKVFQNQFTARREFELRLFEVIEKDMHLCRDGFHGVPVDGGISFNTSLYRTTTIIRSRKTMLTWTMRSLILRLRSRPMTNSISR